MDERTTGLILRTRPLTETSLIVQWLTPDFGRLSTVAKGARRSTSSFRGKLDLFFLADISFNLSRRSELHTLREVTVRDFHKAVRLEMSCLQQASYLAQLLELTTESNTPLPGLFELVLACLAVLERSPAQALTIYAFELKLLSQLGFQPDAARSGLSAGSREILSRLSLADWDSLSCLRLSDAQSAELDRFGAALLVQNFGRIPKARTLAVHPSA